MIEEDLVLAQEFDDQIDEHTRANLLVRLEKLIRYDSDDTGDLTFKRNFKECQKLYEQLDQE